MGQSAVQRHRCDVTPGITSAAQTGCPRFMPSSRDILVLLLKVWALFEEDFQDCSEGSGAALVSIWSVSSGWSELPRTPRARHPMSSISKWSLQQYQEPESRVQCTLYHPQCHIFVSISFTDNSPTQQELEAHGNHRERWGLAHFYFFLFIWFICFASNFYTENCESIRNLRKPMPWRKYYLLGEQFISLPICIKIVFLKMSVVFLWLIIKVMVWRHPTQSLLQPSTNCLHRAPHIP